MWIRCRNSAILALSFKLNQLLFISQAQPTSPAFSVLLDSDSITEPGQRVMYDVVTSNVADGYRTNTGDFTCPISGFYLFSTTSSSSAVLYMNGDIVSTMIQNGGDSGAGISMGVVRCNKDSRVWVESHSTASCNGGLGEQSNSFMGILLASDMENTRF